MPNLQISAMDQLDAQNKSMDPDKMIELTYGPKRVYQPDMKLCPYLAMDKKVLRFEAYFREEMEDWSNEQYRIRPVKVLYYLQNDTMEVIEPKTANSGLLQGTLLKRHVFPHPRGNGRQYLWKDLNLGKDVKVYGLIIHLTDCDSFTRTFLTDGGIELNEPEKVPTDPYVEMKRRKGERETDDKRLPDDKLYKFLMFDRKVLRFFGTWKDLLTEPPEMRKVVLQFYLADDTIEILEDHEPNSGRMPSSLLVKKQKIPVDINELPASFPRTYLEIKDSDLTWLTPHDFRTGQDIVILGKKIFLYDCDDFTRHFYKTRLGIDNMESIAVVKKPATTLPKVFPPHNGIGTWDDSLQNCLSIVPKPPPKNWLKEMHFNGIILRYKAMMITDHKNDKDRRFVFSYYPGDDTVSVNEEMIKNSGYAAGPFLKRLKLKKEESNPDTKPIYYTASDFCIGNEIRAAGKIFLLIDADPFVLSFMEEHPNIYSEDQIKVHKFKEAESHISSKEQMDTRQDLIWKIREQIVHIYGTAPYPLPGCFGPAIDSQLREKVADEMYCANMPISQALIDKVLDLCTDHNNRTNMKELRDILLPALGH